VTGYVIDASVIVKWLVREEGTEQALTLRGHALSAPDLLVAECANILWKKVQRGELTGAESSIAAKLLARAEIELVPMRPLLERTTDLAIRLGHSVYACMYLALADATGRSFVTADARLVRKIAATGAGFPRVIPLADLAA
jgi:predicted nucleic acid-binding protein